MRTRLLILAVISSLACVGAANAAPPLPSTEGTKAFLEKATQNAMTEVALGRLAEKNARSMGINALGGRLARDHARMNTILGLISQDKGLTVPTALDSEHRAIVEDMSSKTGSEFDVAYTELMVRDHASAIQLFSAAAEGDDPDLAAFAKSALPALREQQRLAVSFQKMTAGYRVETAARRD
jgi:putative membrane protein